MADALAEAFSRKLCRFYIENEGFVLHHNVDKLLIAAGNSRPHFGGGEIIEPFDVYLSGRASLHAGELDVPAAQIAQRVVDDFIRSNLHAAPAGIARVHCLVRPGASNLISLFQRAAEGEMPLANDTSIGAAYAPLSPVEQLVLATEQFLTSPGSIEQHPERGEDVKVMALRNSHKVQLTIACAMIGRHLENLDHYVAAKRAIEDQLRDLPQARAFDELNIAVNAADDIKSGSIYLTVSGTSAEAGDDGQTGRGNRVNGLIVPMKPSSMEAIAGKNPVNHVGKLYNVLAQRICDQVHAELEEVTGVHCLLLSRIGQRIDQPAMVELRLRTRSGEIAPGIEEATMAIADRSFKGVSALVTEFTAGTVAIF
ncbi:MAG: methionine adenosyltransferase [Anderseniella sp.]|jgi:S-adenosylmethionine synthetase|nr:methionine adenosyltransferase [Anderseniella sp.]